MQGFGEKPGEKSPLGRHRLRWDHNIQIVVKETELEGFDQINLPQNRYKGLAVVSMVKNILFL